MPLRGDAVSKPAMSCGHRSLLGEKWLMPTAPTQPLREARYIKYRPLAGESGGKPDGDLNIIKSREKDELDTLHSAEVRKVRILGNGYVHLLAH